MPYSQKYTIVAFIAPLIIGAQFDMKEWPLHITLADVFAIERQGATIDAKLTKMLASQSVIKTTAREDATLGTTRVILVDSTNELVTLHLRLIDLLQANGALFNNPEFTRNGFLPHCTIQETGRINSGDELRIDSLALVDMFPDNNWLQRKVISTFSLRDERALKYMQI